MKTGAKDWFQFLSPTGSRAGLRIDSLMRDSSWLILPLRSVYAKAPSKCNGLVPSFRSQWQSRVLGLGLTLVFAVVSQSVLAQTNASSKKPALSPPKSASVSGSVPNQKDLLSIGKAVSVKGTVLVRSTLDPNDPQAKAIADGPRKESGTKLKIGGKLYRGDVLNTSGKGRVKLLMADKTILDLGPTTLFRLDEYQLKNMSNRKVEMTMNYGKIRAVVNRPVGEKGQFKVNTQSATMGVRGTEFIIKSGIESTEAGETTQRRQAIRQTRPGPRGARGSGSGGGPRGGSGGGAPPPSPVAKTEIIVVKGKVEVSKVQPVAKESGADRPPPEAVGKPVTVTAGTKITTVAAVSPNVPLSRQQAASALGGDDGSGQGTVTDADAGLQVEQVSRQEMVVETEEAKIEDETFELAVVVDESSGESQSDTGGNTANDTLLIVADDFELNIDEILPDISDLPYAGVFGPNLDFQPENIPKTTGDLVNLRVVFEK